MARISDRKFPKILKRAILQNPCGETSVVELLNLIELQGQA